MGATFFGRDLKCGSAELLILALLEEPERHGYDLARLIGERSSGVISFHAASLYPTLYRMEDNGLIDGRWVEKVGQRRRRCYRLTAAQANEHWHDSEGYARSSSRAWRASPASDPPEID